MGIFWILTFPRNDSVNMANNSSMCAILRGQTIWRRWLGVSSVNVNNKILLYLTSLLRRSAQWANMLVRFWGPRRLGTEATSTPILPLKWTQNLQIIIIPWIRYCQSGDNNMAKVVLKWNLNQLHLLSIMR